MSDDRPIAGTALFCLLASFAAGAMFGPPDPDSQLIVWGATTLATVPVGWWLAFRGGYERTGAKPPKGFDLLAGGLLAVPGTFVTALLPSLGGIGLGVFPVAVEDAVAGAVFLGLFTWAALYGGAYRTWQSLETAVRPGPSEP